MILEKSISRYINSWMVVTPLYRVVYDADFWKQTGFKNKRAAAIIEEGEVDFLTGYIEDIERTIQARRKPVIKYFREFYADEIDKHNSEDAIISRQIVSNNFQKHIQNAKREAVTEIYEEKFGLLQDANNINSIDKQLIKDRLKSKVEFFEMVPRVSTPSFLFNKEDLQEELPSWSQFSNLTSPINMSEQNPDSTVDTEEFISLDDDNFSSDNINLPRLQTTFTRTSSPINNDIITIHTPMESPYPDSIMDTTSEEHYYNIKNICLEYPDHPCSQRILEYIALNKLI